MIFAVLDPSPLTVCINCSFFFTFFTLMTASKVSEIDGGSKDSALMNSFAMYYMTVSDKISEIHEFKYIEASVFV